MKMVKSNYHTHTTISDGTQRPEELIRAAIKRKFGIIGITDHYHFPRGVREWGNDFYSDEDFRTLKMLKKKYSSKIKILVGVEFDWLEDLEEFVKKEALRRYYDYRMVSIHMIKIGKEYFPVNADEKTFVEMVKKSKGIKNLVKHYYKNMRDAAKSGAFDIIAHMDLIKNWNKEKRYFDENSNWYRKEVGITLKEIKKAKMKIEINTSGRKRPCGEYFPSDWIVEMALKMGIPIIVGTDSHCEKDMENGLDEARRR